MGWRLSGNAGLCEPGGALAESQCIVRRDAGQRQAPCTPTHGLSEVSAIPSVDRFASAAAGAGACGRRRPGRDDDWRAGVSTALPVPSKTPPSRVDTGITGILDACLREEAIDEAATLALFSARDADVEAICQAADQLRQSQVGDTVSYVVNRNINYTNVCQYSCRFCAFSKGGGEVASGRAAYDIDADELHRRVTEAAALGATEICLQGGIHPDYTGQTYLDIVETVRHAAPQMHIHAFSPLEIDQGAQTLNMPVDEYLGC